MRKIQFAFILHHFIKIKIKRIGTDETEDIDLSYTKMFFRACLTLNVFLNLTRFKNVPAAIIP